MKYRVYYRYDYEKPPMAHKTDLNASSNDDAASLLMYKLARLGHRVVIIKSYKLEEYHESRKRHMHPSRY